MRNNPSNFQWETLLDDAEWDRTESLDQLLPTTTSTEPELPVSRSPVRRRISVLALSGVAVCALVLWLAAQHGVSAIDAELHDVVEVENWLERSGDITATSSLFDTDADASWQIARLREMELASENAQPGSLPQALVERTRLRSGLAMVEVTLSAEDGEASREMRFYHETPTGWRRTSARHEFWGREQVLETDHFRIRFRQADGQAVTAAAPQLDGYYEQLRADLGLTGDPPHLTVEVAPVTMESLGFLHFRDGRITVPSPLLLLVAVDVSDEAMLGQSIAQPLVMQVWAEADAAPGIEPWRDGARLWWGTMTQGLQAWQSASACDNARIGCTRTVVRFDAGDPAVPTVTSEAPDSLRHLLAVDEWEREPLNADPTFGTWQRSVAAATVVDYFVQTYGREQLPELVAAFRTHDSWETLIPAVTGVSAAEFEAGWQQFFAEKYGYRASEK